MNPLTTPFLRTRAPRLLSFVHNGDGFQTRAGQRLRRVLRTIHKLDDSYETV